jgi:tRNA nucleotidyltransferase (CCA-adding enzyme)
VVEDTRSRLDVPDAVCEIAKRLEESGYETWTVGGAVRDALLGGYRSDWDLATAARPADVRKLFRPSYPIGIQFGTVGVRASDGRVYEVTTFRRDIETDGRHAVVEYAGTIEEDLARRDFTINAIAYHPLHHTFLDPFAGREDLERRLLRCVGEPAQRFAEDYLRVLRGLRFAGRYRLEIDFATWEALTVAVPRLPRLSAERVREEILKLLAGPGASTGLALYRQSGALALVVPELAGLDDGAWEEILRTIDEIPVQRVHLRLVALLAPAGSEILALMTRLRFSNAEMRETLALSQALAVPLGAAGQVVAARRWLRDVRPERARDTLRLHFAHTRARTVGPAERRDLASLARLALEVHRRGDPVTLDDLAIDGHDLKALGLQPGPEFGRILESCLETVIERPELNRRDVLLDYVRGGSPLRGPG